MKKYMLVGCMLVIGGLLGCGPSAEELQKQEEDQLKASLVQMNVTTLKVYTQDIVDVKDITRGKRFWGSEYEKQNGAILARVEGEARVGVNVHEASIKIVNNRVVISVPNPTVTWSRIDESKTEIITEDHNPAEFNRDKLMDSLREVAEKKISDRAGSQEIIARAKAQFEQLVRGWVSGLTKRSVTVHWTTPATSIQKDAHNASTLSQGDM